MIRDPLRVARFEEEDAARRAPRDIAEAFARYEALWAEARQLNPALGRDWQGDLAADIAIARAVNGLPARG